MKRREFITLMRSCATDVGFVDSRSALPSAAPGRTLSFAGTVLSYPSFSASVSVDRSDSVDRS
jgi:hypothetical protein